MAEQKRKKSSRTSNEDKGTVSRKSQEKNEHLEN